MEWARLKNPAFLTCLAVLAVSGVTLNAAIAFFRVHLRKAPIYAPNDRQVSAIPAQTPTFERVGEDGIEGEAMIEELGTHNYLNRTYLRKGTDEGGRPIVLQLHLAYYTGMIDTVPHVPERCMVGGGWQIAGSAGVVPLELDQSRWIPVAPPPGADEATASVFEGVVSAPTSYDSRYSQAPGMRVNLPRHAERIGLRTTEFAEPGSGLRMFAGYFFIANGGVATSAEDVRLLAFDLKDEYAYYLKVQVSSVTVSSAEELAEQASDLISQLLPEIMRCVPDWVEVQMGRYPAAEPAGGPAPASGGAAASFERGA